jgi:phosphatidylserine decarboxylase
MTESSIFDYVKAWPQYLLPHFLLSNAMHSLTRCKNRLLKNCLIHWFIKLYNVDMGLAEQSNIDHYIHFNDFFTRSLKPSVRPICAQTNAVACPVDGSISQLGNIKENKLFQAKGQNYSLIELLGGNSTQCKTLFDGLFATIYLSPRDYHRIHMPIDGNLVGMTYVPGRLFSVNAATTRVVPGLFSRNERVIAYFQTAVGLMAMVLVGALFVGSIETIWHGTITPPHGKSGINEWHYKAGKLLPKLNSDLHLEKGAEMGRFNMGSTVIVVYEKNALNWAPQLHPSDSVQMGQQIATLSS